ncbi:MAG TPA: rhomboid family intramembrane serine protease [Candidatus Angelobacter sp.]
MGSRPGIKSYRVSFDFYITPGVKLLLLANFAVFIFEALLYRFSGPAAYAGLVKWFGLVPAGVVPLFRIWQPFTYLFLHDVNSIWHILMNMFMLWMFGRELELLWGKNRFLRYYFLTGVGAGIINVFVKTLPALFGHGFSYIPTIGASGAIFGILMACAILFPDRRVYLLPFPVAMSMRTVVMIMAAFTFLGTFGLGGDNVSHLCHLGGMLVGYVYLRRGSFLYSLRNSVSDWQHRRNRKRFEVYMSKHRKEPPSRPDNWVN